MAFDPVSAVSNALAAIAGAVKPVIDEHYAQQYENDHKERMYGFDKILDLPDSDDRARRMYAYVGELLVRAGSPAGDVSGERSIAVPAGHFRTLVQLCSELIRDEQRIARLTFKVG